MTTVAAALGLTPDQVADLLAAASRAPAGHKSHPWRFLVRPQVIELWADPERRLPAADPVGREHRVACGPRCSTCAGRCAGAASDHSSPCTPTGTTPIFWPRSATAET